MRSWWFLPISFAAAAAVHAQGAASLRVEIEYEFKRNGKTVAEVLERLEHANGSYQMTETWKGKGVYAVMGKAKRTSQGSIDADGLRPHEFVDERSGRDTQRVSFDWSAGTITRRYKGATRTEPVPRDTQDRLSFLFALSFAPQKDVPISFHVADARGMSRHAYQPDGHERIATPAGEFDTVKYMRRNEGSNEVAQVWLAANRDYL